MHRLQVGHTLKPTPTHHIQNVSDRCQANIIFPWDLEGEMHGMSVFNQHLYLNFDPFVV